MMSTILAFLFEYRFIIAIIIAVVIYALCEWNKFKSTAYGLMLTARRMAQKKILEAGEPEEDWVVKQLYIHLPRRITIFIKEENMRKAVKWLFELAKDFMDDGKINKSIKKVND